MPATFVAHSNLHSDRVLCLTKIRLARTTETRRCLPLKLYSCASLSDQKVYTRGLHSRLRIVVFLRVLYAYLSYVTKHDKFLCMNTSNQKVI